MTKSKTEFEPREHLFYKFTKIYRGGSYTKIVMLLYDAAEWKDNLEDFLQEEMERWGESRHGGENYGYRVECEKIVPTQDDVQALLTKYENKVRLLTSSIEGCKKEINYLEEYSEELDKL